MKNILTVVTGLTLALSLAAGCSSDTTAPMPPASSKQVPTGIPATAGNTSGTVEPAGGAEEVTLDLLMSSPDSYNGRKIVLEGFYFHGFETIVLSKRLEETGFAEGHLWPRGQIVWVEGSIPTGIYDQLFKQEMMGPTERYGKLRVEGLFEHGAQYGHLGGFSSRIVPSEVELVPWSPPRQPH
ncbi:MAG: hypothetical protein QF467_06940 [SAR202 cluster bacterium]|nr:hypothetical protein [SAR202 cluster bacterium]